MDEIPGPSPLSAKAATLNMSHTTPLSKLTEKSPELTNSKTNANTDNWRHFTENHSGKKHNKKLESSVNNRGVVWTPPQGASGNAIIDPAVMAVGKAGSPNQENVAVAGATLNDPAVLAVGNAIKSTKKGGGKVMPPEDDKSGQNARGGRPQQAAIDPYVSRRVHVSGFPQFTQLSDLKRTFSKFGKVQVERMSQKNSFAYLLFKTEEDAKAAIKANKTVIVYGEILQVTACTPRQEQPPQRVFTRSKQKDAQIIDPKLLVLSGDFYEQMEVILAQVRLTQEEAARIGALYEDVERVLQELWPGCVAMPFGSITTGLGIKSSDADCFVQVGRGAAPAARVPRAARALQHFPALFSEILPIPRANTPIVKFFHVPTATNCDLSFKTILGARNSRLISNLLHRHPRLIPAAVLLKYWAKTHQLTGTGKLTNYALTMMVIFYFQRLGLLPAVEWLQRGVPEMPVDYWNTAFAENPWHQPPCDPPPESELVGGFFQFYAKFNFDDDVVCPFLGRAVKKDSFRNVESLPPEYTRYKHNVQNNLVMPMRFMTPMCVQDPFEQSHNVASSVSGRLAFEIKAYLQFAAEAYEKEKENACRDFLKKILLGKPEITREKGAPDFRMSLFPKLIRSIETPDWKAAVREIVFTIFQEMLKLEPVKVEEKPNPEAKKEKEKYMLNMKRAVWKRKSFIKIFRATDLEFKEKQKKITEEVLRVENEDIDIKLHMTLIFAPDRSGAITLRLLSGDTKSYIDFGKFFISTIQSWFFHMLKPYLSPPKSAQNETSVNNTNTEIKSKDDVLLNSKVQAANGLDSDDDEDEAVQEAASGSRNKSNSREDGPKCDNDKGKDGPRCDNNEGRDVPNCDSHKSKDRPKCDNDKVQDGPKCDNDKGLNEPAKVEEVIITSNKVKESDNGSKLELVTVSH